ncbi:MAG: acyl-CoA dehydrogenase family protein [Candidatus Lustribacter sp.]
MAEIDWLARVRGLAPAIAAAIPHIDAGGKLPDELDAALHAAGMYRLLIPHSCGGAELDPVTFAEIIEAVATHDASTAWVLGQVNGAAMSAAYLELDVAREIFAASPAVLAWGPPAADSPHHATIVEGGYRVTGTWQFASGSRQANWLGGLCLVCEPDGSQRTNANGRPQTRTVLFPKANAVITDTWQVVGLRGTGSDQYAVTDLFVPAGRTFQRDRGGWSEPGPLYRLSTVYLHAVAFGAVALGIARASLDAFVELARHKKPARGNFGQPLRENNAVQGRIGLAEAQLRAARAYLLGAARAGYAEAATLTEGTVGTESRIDMRAASTLAINLAEQVVDIAYRLAGATAIFDAQPFERRFRDMHAVTQQIQGHFSNYETLGQYRLGLPFDLSI